MISANLAYSYVPLMLRRIANRAGKPFGINPFPRAFAPATAADSIDTVFDEIYIRNLWGNPDSRSGVGSDLRYTKGYSRELTHFLQQKRISRLFDAPCGDLLWMAKVLEQCQLNYIGGDISSSLVKDVKQRHPKLDIRHFDITRDTFPDADAWHCRDCLFHLSFINIAAALRQVAATDYRYVLLTTHKSRLFHHNLDIDNGGFRYLDLEKPPFSFPAPERYLSDYRKGFDFPRYVGVWRLCQLQDDIARLGATYPEP